MPRSLPGRPRRVRRVDDTVRELTPTELYDAIIDCVWQAFIVGAAVYAVGALFKYCG